MPVSKECRVNSEAVQVDFESGEKLFYVIEVTDGEVEYTLRESPGEKTLADSASCPSKCEREWPRDESEVPDQTKVTHTLGMQFLSPGTVKYQVRHRKNGDSEVVIDCDYVADDSNPSFFEGLDVFTA